MAAHSHRIRDSHPNDSRQRPIARPEPTHESNVAPARCFSLPSLEPYAHRHAKPERAQHLTRGSAQGELWAVAYYHLDACHESDGCVLPFCRYWG